VVTLTESSILQMGTSELLSGGGVDKFFYNNMPAHTIMTIQMSQYEKVRHQGSIQTALIIAL